MVFSGFNENYYGYIPLEGKRMKIAFLNLCHCEPEIVARVANKLTQNKDFDMYVHVDAKQDVIQFSSLLRDNKQVFFLEERYKVYWGGFHAVMATFALLEKALESDRQYDYFIALQNLDYPIKSNYEIQRFFEKNKGTEFIRGCKIAKTKDLHYSMKYKLFNNRDLDFYLKKHNPIVKIFHDGMNAIKSIPLLFFNGVIKEADGDYLIHYGTAQWAITRECAEYVSEFYQVHEKFNHRMRHIKFPDEEYIHTVVHNSKFKYQCSAFDEPESRWLVNWRNIHYFEFPKEVTVFDETYFEKIRNRPELFIRKVKSGVSDKLMDQIDNATKE